MRRHCHRAQLVDDVFSVIAFAGAKCDRHRSASTGSAHVQRGHPSAYPSAAQAGLDQQAMAVLHQPVPDEGQLRLSGTVWRPDRWSRHGCRSSAYGHGSSLRHAPAVLRWRLARTVLCFHALHRRSASISVSLTEKSSLGRGFFNLGPGPPPRALPRCRFPEPVAVVREYEQYQCVVDADFDEPAQKQVRPLHQKLSRIDRVKRL